MTHGVDASDDGNSFATGILDGNGEMSLQAVGIECLLDGWKSETGFDKENTALKGSVIGETVGQVGPSTVPTGEGVDIETTLEHIFVDDALSVDVIGHGFPLRSIPDAELGNVEAGRVGCEMIVVWCKKWRRRN